MLDDAQEIARGQNKRVPALKIKAGQQGKKFRPKGDGILFNAGLHLLQRQNTKRHSLEHIGKGTFIV